jgi:hypothetical protein
MCVKEDSTEIVDNNLAFLWRLLGTCNENKRKCKNKETDKELSEWGRTVIWTQKYVLFLYFVKCKYINVYISIIS